MQSEMLQWPQVLRLAWLCVSFLRTSEIMFLHFKLASCGNELLILTFSNSKYSELKRKNQNNRTNMGHEDSSVLTGIAH